MIGVAKTFGNKWVYIGLVPLFDPPRDNAAKTVKEIKEIGVKVKMVTGDHVAIAKEIGIGTRIYAIDELKKVHVSEQAKMIEEANGFAEVLPEHKYIIVDILQKTAMQ